MPTVITTTEPQIGFSRRDSRHICSSLCAYTTPRVQCSYYR
jgi:hypothetical protein